MIHVTNSIAIDERDVEERFVRGSGPGGQNVNKVATTVQLRFDVDRSSLPSDVKTRLRTLAGSRVSARGLLILDSREHRTQAMNREAAWARLLELVRKAAVKPRARRPTAPTAAAGERRLTAKKRRALSKRTRTKTTQDE